MNCARWTIDVSFFPRARRTTNDVNNFQLFPTCPTNDVMEMDKMNMKTDDVMEMDKMDMKTII
jgi:hypothetical protein